MLDTIKKKKYKIMLTNKRRNVVGVYTYTQIEARNNLDISFYAQNNIENTNKF